MMPLYRLHPMVLLSSALVMSCTSTRLEPVPPRIAVSGAAAAVQGVPYILHLSAPRKPSSKGTAVKEWLVDWGDGTDVETFAGSPSSVKHTFQDAFDETSIQAWVVDGNGQWPASALSLAIASSTPAVTATGSSSVVQGAAFTIKLAAAYRLTGPGITQWTVEFGDGTTASPDMQNFPGNTRIVHHVFAAGVLRPTIYVSATDANGTYDAAPLTVSVTGVSAPSAPTSQLGQEPLGLVLVRESHDKIIRVADDDHIAGRVTLSPLIHPQVQNIVQVHIRQQR